MWLTLPPPPLLDTMPSLALLLLPLLLVKLKMTLADDHPALFMKRQVQHASTPLKTAHLASDLQCGIFCLRTPDCLKWARDRDTSDCRLLPIHSADNPLTEATGRLFQRPHPPDYVPMPGSGGVAYRPHSRLTPAGQVLLKLCREDDPEAVPALITTDDQFNFLMSMPMPYPYQWLSINDFEEEGVYKDLTNSTTVDLGNWIAPHSSYFHHEAYDSVLLQNGFGLVNRPYTDKHSYLCEHWM